MWVVVSIKENKKESWHVSGQGPWTMTLCARSRSSKIYSLFFPLAPSGWICLRASERFHCTVYCRRLRHQGNVSGVASPAVEHSMHAVGWRGVIVGSHFWRVLLSLAAPWMLPTGVEGSSKWAQTHLLPVQGRVSATTAARRSQNTC
jgi:hypothetical protein